MTVDVIFKPWKLNHTSHRVLDINANLAVFHQVIICTVDNEPIMNISLNFLTNLEPVKRSQLDLEMASHIVDVHNRSLKGLTGNSPEPKILTVNSPKKKRIRPSRSKSAIDARKKAAESIKAAKEPQKSNSPGLEVPYIQSENSKLEENIQEKSLAPPGEGWFTKL